MSYPQTLRPIEELDYYDTRSLELARAVTPLDVWNFMTADRPPLLELAFGIRDAISSVFGVKRIGGFSGVQKMTVKVGDRLDFFLVEHVSPDQLVLTERDRHLDVMTCISTAGKTVTITASVVTHRAQFDLNESDRRSKRLFLKHNFVDPRFVPVELCSNAFGRAYMLPVGLAHKLIVNAMLRRLRRRSEAG